MHQFPKIVHLKPMFYGLIVVFSLLFSVKVNAQFDIPPIPEKQTSVYDYAGLLSSVEKASLEQKLIKYSDTTSTQIVVAIINTSKGENMGLLTPRWGHKWKIGQEKEDNGVFILLARDDRQIWIAPGYGVEHKLTAGINGELIRNVIIPEFKRGNYYAGLDKGSDAIFQVLLGEYQGTRQTSDSSGIPPQVIAFLFVLFVFFILAISSHKRGGGRGSGGKRSNAGSLLEAIILSNMGRGSIGGGSSWGGSSGGGSFGGSGGFGGGFGGGGFSGGGAGGSW